MSRRQGQLALSEIVTFLQRHGRLVAGLAILGAILTLGAAFFLVAEEFETAATLAVVPSSLATELVESTLPIQAYQTLLESDSVVGEASRRLVASGHLGAGDSLQVGKSIRSRIFVSNRSDQTLSPLIVAYGTGATAEQAAAIANTWAEVLLESTRRLFLDTASPSAAFVEEQFPEAESELRGTEDVWLATSREFHEKRDQAAAAWDDRLVAARRQAADRFAAHRAETRQQMESFLSTVETRLAGLIPAETVARFSSLVAVRSTLAQTSPTLSLEKAVTDDVLWESLILEDERPSSGDSLWSNILVTEELNPAYAALTTRAVELELELREGAPLSTFNEFLTELERLQVERESSLAKLREGESTRLAKLLRSKQRELEGLNVEGELRLRQLRRQIQQLESLRSELGEKYNEVLLSKAQERVNELVLAAPAVAVARPESRHLLLRSVLGALVGAALGILGGIFLERDAAGPRKLEATSEPENRSQVATAP